MSDIQLYLLEAEKDKQEARKIAVQSALKLQSQRLKLIDLVTSLGEYINNKEDGQLRSRTAAYLADVLENTPTQVLSGQERKLLRDFVLARVESDSEGIGSAARSLIALEGLGKWDEETAQSVAVAFVSHANPLKQFKLQTDRHAAVRLFDLLMAKYRTALSKVHDRDDNFMTEFVTFFDGEKDPRNLMTIFSILYVPMIEWDVHAHARELFEAVFNYFPVAFRPPPDDPYGITAQDLKDRLKDCISANSDFAPFAFPQLLDKLDSSYMNTKRDVLQAIQACISGYAANTINLYAVDLWDALKFEILNVQEEDLGEAALLALSLIAGKFIHLDGPLNAFLRPIIKECNEHLEDAPTKQSIAAGRILYSVASAGQAVADKIARGILPVLFSLYGASESIAKRRGLLEVLNQILKAYGELSRSYTNANPETVAAFVREALPALLGALHRAPKAEVSFRLTALEGVTRLLAVPRLLSQEQSHQIVDAVTNIILHETVHDHGDIRLEAIKALSEMAHSAPNAIRDRAVPAFIVELPDVPNEGRDYGPVLEAFAQLSGERLVFDVVVRRLRDRLTAARRQQAPSAYQRALLLAILYAFSRGSPIVEDTGILRSSYFTDYAEPLIANAREDAAHSDDPEVLEVIGRITNIILRPQSVHFQNKIYHKYAAWPTGAEEGQTISSHMAERLAPLSLHYYAAIRPEVIELETAISLLQVYATLALNADTSPAMTSILLRHISLLVNKFIDPKAMQLTLTNANIEVETLLSQPTNPRTIGVAFTIVKALLIQGKAPTLTTNYLTALLKLLSISPKSTATHFAALLSNDDILTKQNHCRVSGLYKQKVFNQIIPPLIEEIRTADAAIKPNYLIALSGILRWLPYSMLEPSLAPLVPPLLQILDLQDTEDQISKPPILTVFEDNLLHGPEILAQHTALLITRLLACTTSPGNTASVRTSALRVLALVPKALRREIVVPFRGAVVRGLGGCLDDPRREVRGAGVRCRTAWLGLDDDGEEN